MHKQIASVAVVNFRPAWGNKELNLQRILDYIEIAYKKGIHILVFPETALNGYEEDVIDNKPMHQLLAETMKGDSIRRIERKVKACGLYAAFGAAERSGDKIYNSAFICGPDGLMGVYRKAHLPGRESLWADAGEKGPFIFDSPWGKIAVAICYDVYNFPEITRYAKAMGARLLLNCTACSKEANKWDLIRKALEYHVQINTIYIASANMAGRGKDEYFIGGSSIIGPDNHTYETCTYYAGTGFFTENSDQAAMLTADIDLSLADNNSNVHLFRTNPYTGKPDWRPELYCKMYKEAADSVEWKNLIKKEAANGKQE